MRTPVVLAVASAVLAAVAIVVGCQTYDFEPVQPIAIAQTTASYSTIGRSLKPNMALLVDKSGSMNFAVNPSDPNCDVGTGLPSNCGQTLAPPCPAACPTRWGDLKAAMTQFLSNNGKSRAIPVFVFYTREMEYITRFVERPSSAQAQIDSILDDVSSRYNLAPGTTFTNLPEAGRKEVIDTILPRFVDWQRDSISEMRQLLSSALGLPNA